MPICLTIGRSTVDERRYRLLEPVRQYGVDKLAAGGDEAEVRSRHASVYVDLAAGAASGLDGPAQVAWLERLDNDLPNLRLAMDWLKGHGNNDEAHAGLQRLALALVGYWEVRGHLTEGEEWLELALAHTHADIPLRVQVLLGLGRLAFWHVDLERAAERFDNARALAHEHADARGAAVATAWLGAVRRRQARFAEAQALLELSFEQLEAHEDEAAAAWAVFNLALIADRTRGTLESARLNEDALRRYRALGNVWLAAMLSVLLAADLVDLAQLERVPQLLGDALEALEATGDQVFLTTGLVTLAYIAARMNQPVRATKLLGCVEFLNERRGIRVPPNTRETMRITQRNVRSQLDADSIESAMAAGRRLTREGALGEVRDMMGQGTILPSPVEPSRAIEALTRRERMVAELLSRGLSDRRIALELGITPRTAGVHVRNILSKLGVRSRWQVRDALPLHT